MARLVIKKGDIYGSFTVVKEGEKLRLPSGQVNRTITCKCECGVIKDVRLSHLKRGKISSCGCKGKTINGESQTDIGRLYSGIKSRCSPYHSERHLYYDKGIKMCNEWLNDFLKFKMFCLENGYKHGLQIDRIDGDEGYSPINCRFVTPKVNCNNRINTYMVDWGGEQKPLCLLIEELGIKIGYSTILARLKRGWNIKDALYKNTASNYRNRKKIKELK